MIANLIMKMCDEEKGNFYILTCYNIEQKKFITPYVLLRS